MYLAIFGFGGSYEQTKYITAVVFYGLISLYIFFFPLFLIIHTIKDAKKNKSVKQNPDRVKADWIMGIAILLHLALVTYITYAIFNLNMSLNDATVILSPGLFLVSGVLIIGLSYYMKSKGQSRWLAILGLLGLIGYIIVLFIPDKKKLDK